MLASEIRSVFYYPFGMMMVGRSFSSEGYRFGFNGMENEREVNGSGKNYDFGARIYNARLSRWLSLDPAQASYPGFSPYHFVRNNPILRIDQGGLWDIEVHVYKSRAKYGYGIAIVKDRNGNEINRFKVRVEGVSGRDRMKTGNDTPNGTYDIPDTDMWIAGSKSGEKRESYGANDRLILNGMSGEIQKSGRSLIRIHGGRQESYNEKTKTWERDENAELKKTEGCLRTYDNDILELKTLTDALLASDPEEFGGTLTIMDDLRKIGGKYYAPSDVASFAQSVGAKIRNAVFDLIGSGKNKEEFKQEMNNQACDTECDMEQEASKSDVGVE